MRIKFVSTDCIHHSFCIGCSENQFNRLSGHIEDDLKEKGYDVEYYDYDGGCMSGRIFGVPYTESWEYIKEFEKVLKEYVKNFK